MRPTSRTGKGKGKDKDRGISKDNRNVKDMRQTSRQTQNKTQRGCEPNIFDIFVFSFPKDKNQNLLTYLLTAFLSQSVLSHFCFFPNPDPNPNLNPNPNHAPNLN